MNTHQFVLVLDNENEKTPNLEDRLFEAGCDDALINFRDGKVYLDFDRKASSLDKAINSAIKDLESFGFVVIQHLNIPNKETTEAMENVKNKVGLKKFNSTEEILDLHSDDIDEYFE